MLLLPDLMTYNRGGGRGGGGGGGGEYSSGRECGKELARIGPCVVVLWMPISCFHDNFQLVKPY